MALRIATITYATHQGLGHLARSFCEAGVVTDPVIFRHNHYPTHTEWYPSNTPLVSALQRPFAGQEQVQKVLNQVDAFVFFETPFDWTFLSACRNRKVKTVLVPMYEWTPRRWPDRPDLLACPSLLDLDFFKAGSIPAVHLPIPVDPNLWQKRTRALRYLHNAGHIGHRQHKGTLELLKAVQHLRSNLTLTVRCQDQGPFQGLLRTVPGIEKDPRVTFEYGDKSQEELWANYDVYVAPEKFNGLSLPIQEARAAGLLVMTTDRYPANTWLPRAPLLPAARYEPACISQNYLEFEEAIVEPAAIAATMDAWHGRDISEYSLSGKRWAEENSWEALKPRWLEAIEHALVSR